MAGDGKKFRRRIVLTSIALVFAAIVAGFFFRPQPDDGSERTRLCSLPYDGDCSVDGHLISPDGMRCVVSVNREIHAALDLSYLLTETGELAPITTANSVYANDALYSADSKHLAVLFKERLYNTPTFPQEILTMDGQTIVEYRPPQTDYVPSWWRMTDDGKLEYLAYDGSLAYFVTSKGRTRNYDSLMFKTMSPAGAEIWRGRLNDDIYFIIDGVEYGPYPKAQPDISDERIDFTPDGRHSTCIMNTVDGKKIAVVDGKVIAKYDGIAYLTLLPSGKIALVAKKGERQSLVIDGVEGKWCDNIVGEPVFSPNEKDVAYGIYISPGGRRIVVNGVAGEVYDHVSQPVFFGSDGKSFAYAAYDDDDSVLCINGKEVANYDGVRVGEVAVSADGKRLAYCAWVRKSRTTKLVVDGQEKINGNAQIRDMMFSPDGKRFACQVKDGSSCYVFCDDKAGVAYESIHNLRFDENNVLTYKAYKFASPPITVSVRETAEMTLSSSLFSVDGLIALPRENDVCWPNRARLQSESRICAGMMKLPENSTYDTQTGMLTTPKWRRSVWIESKSIPSRMIQFGNCGHGVNNEYKVFVDGVGGSDFLMVGGFAISPDGKQYAYCGVKSSVDDDAKFYLVRDGKETLSPAAISFITFSPDSKHIAYRQTTSPGSFDRWLAKMTKSYHVSDGYDNIVVDGQVLNSYQWVSRPYFQADGTLIYYAIGDGAFYRVTKKMK